LSGAQGTNLEFVRKEGDAVSKQKVPGFSERQEMAPLRTRDVGKSSLDPEHSDQHGDLAAPSHKARPDICGRRLQAKHLRCAEKFRKFENIFKTFHPLMK